MSWNYRIMRHKEDDDTWYGVHEVYYNSENEIVAWTVEPDIYGEDVAEIEDILESMIKDIRKPEHSILDFDMIPEGDWDEDAGGGV